MSRLQQLIDRFSANPRRRRVGPIGVELSHERLNLVQFQRAEDGLILRAQASVILGESRAAVLGDHRRLRTLLARARAADRFKGRNIVAAMPSGAFRTMTINYRPSAGQADESAIGSLMAERLEGDLSDYVIDYLPVRGQGRDGERVALVAVSRRDEVLGYLEALRSSGLQTEALEIGPVAIKRLVGAMSARDDSDIVLVINTGVERSYLTLIAGRRLLFDQEVRFGEAPLLARLSQSLDMSHEMARDLVMRTGLDPGNNHDAVSKTLSESGIFNTLLEIVKPELLNLVAEIERAFIYAASETRGGAVTRVFLLGSLARWPGAETALAELTEVDVSKMPDPLADYGATSATIPGMDAAELAVATGLALRGMVDDG